MKNIKIMIVLGMILLLFFYFINEVEASVDDEVVNIGVVQLRAGGGGSSSGGSSSGRGSSSSNRYYGSRFHSNRSVSIIGVIFQYVIFGVVVFGAAIMFYAKVIRSSVNSRRLLKLLDDKDKVWKYKNIEKQVINTFYLVQESWANMDMLNSKDYMSIDLYEEFNTKLEWMKIGNKKNILKKIKLVNLKPVSVHDDENDSKDLIWFYIKGRMIDYTINTETNEKLDGDDYSKSFIEFWKFIRNDDDRWILAEILQKDEADKIKFQDDCKYDKI